MPNRHSLKFLFTLLLLVAALGLTGCSDDDENSPTAQESGGGLSGTDEIVITTDPGTLPVAWTLTGPGGTSVSGEGDFRQEHAAHGEYTIAWPQITGWNGPNPMTQVQELTSGNNLLFSAIYLPQPGTGMINILPEGLEAAWDLEGPRNFEVSSMGDTTLLNLEPGVYEIAWGDVEGFETPDNTVASANTISPLIIEVEYSLPDSTLYVNPLPRGTDAPWTITGPVEFEETGSGDGMVAVTTTGDYIITWGEVAEMITPDPESFEVEFEDDENILLEGLYLDYDGTVTVSGVIGTQDIPWSLTGPSGATQMGSGMAELTGMRAGQYTVAWLPSDGWVPGAGETQELGSAGSISFAAAASSAVTIRPLPMDLYASWQLTGPGGYSLDGSGEMTIDNLDAGSYTLTWDTVSGWTAPTAGNGTLAADNGLVFQGEYQRGDGTIFVNAKPADLDIPWEISGPDGFSESGVGLSTISIGGAGDYTIAWTPIDGYIPPANQILSYEGTGNLEFRTLYQEQLDLISLTAGTFLMGSIYNENCRSGFEAQHEVTLTRDFIIKATEVTNAEYISLAQWAYDQGLVTVDQRGVYDNLDGSTEELLDLDDNDMEIFFADGLFTCIMPDHPVREVSWYGAAAFCDWLSLYRGLDRAYDHESWLCGSSEPSGATGFRLPTEAEWEYACRAGSVTAYGNDIGIFPSFDGCYSDDLDTICWYDRSSDAWTTDVAQLDPNEWGLYDMHGNALEWVNDWMQSNYYDPTGSFNPPPSTDPPGPLGGTERVQRGGYFFSPVEGCRSASRYSAEPSNASYEAGFRFVLTGN